MSSNDPLYSTARKLTEFAQSLPEDEREVLGELLVHSLEHEHKGEAGEDELFGSIVAAKAAGKTHTRLSLGEAPEGLTLVAKGVSAGRLA